MALETIDKKRARAAELLAKKALVRASFAGADPSGPLTPNAAQKQPAWFIAPATGNDQNAGTSAGAPLKTWRELARRWGTVSPVLEQDTTVTFLESSPSDGSDPVVWTPYLLAGARAALEGPLGPAQRVATVTLAGVVPKNRAAAQLLEADLGPGRSPGLLVRNTSRGGAVCWTYRNVAGDVWSLTQPLAPVSVPTAADGFPAEVDTFANGDTVELYAPVRVDVARLEPTMVDYDAGFDNALYVLHVTIADPSGAPGTNVLYRGAHVWMLESQTERAIFRTSEAADLNELTTNVYNVGGWYGGTIRGPFDAIIGGALLPAVAVGAQAVGNSGVALDGDVIVAGALGFGDGVFLGLVYVEGGSAITLSGGRSTLIDIGYGTAVDGQALWGPGGLQLLYTASLYVKAGPPEAWGFAQVLLITGPITLNLGTTANSQTVAGGTVTIHAGITVSAANLDAAAGAAGFGGRAFILGGASIVGSEG